MSNIDNKVLYTINRLSAANLADVAKLCTSVYGKVLAAGYLERKYDTAYTKAQYVGFIAYNSQMLPVAFYGVIPCFILCDGEQVLTAQSADTMTHPDYRNKGLFVELAKHTFELCTALGIQFLFGFPNQNSLPGFINKLGWQVAQQLDCFIIPVKTFPLEKIAAKFPVLKNFYTSYINGVLSKYLSPLTGIQASVLSDGYNGVLRNEGFLQSKSYSSTKVISVEGAQIWIKINNGLQIGDIQVTAEKFPATIIKLQHIAIKLGLTQIQFHTSKDTKLYRLFAAKYEAIESFPVIFKQLGSNMPMDKIRFTLADIDIF